MRAAIKPRPRGKTLLIYFVTLLGFGLGISEAAAHSRLVKSDPSARAVIETAPKEMKLWFNENIEPAFAKIWIVAAAGKQTPLTSRGDSSDPHLLVITLPDDLPPGPVNIGYHVLSVDGHVVDDKLTFTIRKPN